MYLTFGLCIWFFSLLGIASAFLKLVSAAAYKSGKVWAVKMSHGKHTRVLLLNDMEKLDKTLFRLEQGQYP